VTLALIFPEFNGNAHPQAWFDALDRAIHPKRPIDGETRAKSGADPKNIVGFDEHSAGANVSRASIEPGGTPFDFEYCLIGIAGRPTTF